jgi:monoamine oxidase
VRTIEPSRAQSEPENRAGERSVSWKHIAGHDTGLRACASCFSDGPERTYKCAEFRHARKREGPSVAIRRMRCSGFGCSKRRPLSVAARGEPGRTMTRTPLFREVRRALTAARVAAQSGGSIDPALEARAGLGRQRTRRRFLRDAAIAASALAAPSCVRGIDARDTGASVAVVGAGIAGLTCAYRLHCAGVRVRVYEAQDRVGGRMFTGRGLFQHASAVELGGELIDSGHVRLRSLAAELGFELDDLHADAPDLARSLWFFQGERRSEREVVEAFVPIASAIARDRAVLGDAEIGPNSPPPIAALDRLSFAQWLDREGVSGWIRSLLEVAYETEMGLAPDAQSALNFLTLIDSNPDPFRVFGESDERYHVRGGNDQIPRELARRMAGSIETRSVLESVRQHANGDFELSFRCGQSVRTALATHIVLALPLTLLRQCELAAELPPRVRAAVRELAYGTNAKLMIEFQRRVWREDARSDGSTFSDLPYQTTWETTRAQREGGGGVLVNFVGGQRGVKLGRGTPEDQAASCVQNLEHVFPGISAVRSRRRGVRFHWPSNPWVQGSYVCLRPGDWTRFAGAFDAAVGRLRFAGEHCSRYAQGFMEGGCESGERVARTLLAELGVEQRLSRR